MFKKTCIGLGTFLVVTSSSLLASAQSASAGEFNVCNYTGERIWTTIAYYASDDTWTTEGWWQLNQTECKKIHNSLENTRFYLYANGETGKTWEANYPFCIEPARPFMIRNASNTAGCAAVRNFFSVWVPDIVTGNFPDSYTYTFGPNNINLNNPRA